MFKIVLSSPSNQDGDQRGKDMQFDPLWAFSRVMDTVPVTHYDIGRTTT